MNFGSSRRLRERTRRSPAKDFFSGFYKQREEQTASTDSGQEPRPFEPVAKVPQENRFSQTSCILSGCRNDNDYTSEKTPDKVRRTRRRVVTLPNNRLGPIFRYSILTVLLSCSILASHLSLSRGPQSKQTDYSVPLHQQAI